MTTCLKCAHIDLRAKPKHTKSGWAPCKAQLIGEWQMIVMIQRERECGHFSDAPADIVAKREVWILKLQGENKWKQAS